MPITLKPISRREFLVRSAAAVAGVIAGPHLFAGEPPTDPHRFALLADTHIDANPDMIHLDANMTDNLRFAVRDLMRLDSMPSAAFVIGDLANVTGEIPDYAAFTGLLRPVREAGLTVHLTLGNHDQREHFWKAIPPHDGEDKPVKAHHVAIVKARRANFFIMDSLDQTNVAPGLCGQAQLTWLARALDANARKPAITMIHHQPDERQKNLTGLIDTKALMEVILPRRQVKAHIFGHTHNWDVANRDGLHLVNLPPTAYVFTPGRPSGWVDMQLENDGARLELYSIDPTHPEAHKPVTLKWR